MVSWTRIIEFAGIAAGMVRLDRPEPGAGLEISILIDPGCQGMGLGRRAVEAVAALYPREAIDAYIDPANTASERLFAGSGYHRGAEGWWHLPPREGASNV